MKRIFSHIINLTGMTDTHFDPQYRIGMRVVKTVAAVMVCLLISLLTHFGISMLISSITALVTLRGTQGETLSSGVFRLIGTIVGGFFGMLVVIIGLYLPYYSDGLFVLVIPLMLLIDLYVCNLLKLQDSCQISCVVILVVTANVNLGAGSIIIQDPSIGSAFVFTLSRLRDTLIGVVVATIMNIAPYKISEMLKKQ